jgi:DNA-binding CsgD family transcriptional regulator
MGRVVHIMNETIIELISSVYQAPHSEGGWDRFFQQLLEKSNSKSGVLSTESGTTGINIKPVIQRGFDPSHLANWAEHYIKIDPWIERMSNMPNNAFYLADSIYPRKKFLQSEIFIEFSSKMNNYHASGACITTKDTNHSVQITLQRGKSQGEHNAEEFKVLNLLVPHIQQALWLDTALVPITSTKNTIVKSLGDAAFLCDLNRKVLHLNDRAESLCRASKKVRLLRGVLSLVDGGLTRKFQDSIDEIALSVFGFSESKIFSFQENGVSFLVRVVPWIARETDLSLGLEQILVVVKAVDGVPNSAREAFRQTFGLSPRETEVSELLARGDKPQLISEQLDILESTVRTHIKALLRKTDSRSVQRFVALYHSADSQFR